jgi:Methyltransferase domain
MKKMHLLESKHVQGAKLYANRIDMIKDISLPKGSRISEIGVAFGDFSEELISSHQPSEFVAFDLFELHKIPVIWGKPSAETFNNKEHLPFYQDRLSKYASSTSVKIHKGDSSTQLSNYPDAHFDLIYIDGAHDYDGVMKDADVAQKKLAKNGYLVFNDYIYFDHIAKEEYGIIPVVNDLCVNQGWKVVGFAFQSQMFCDIGIVRA